MTWEICEGVLYLKCIYSSMEIYIRPKTKEARKIIYMDLNEEQRKEVDNRIFLPEKAYPKLERGRPARYDFLYIWIPNLESSYVNNVERYLSEKLERPVFSYSKKIKDVNGYIFILPYRDVKTGKALSYTMKLYYTLRKDLYSLARGEVIKVKEIRPEERPAPEQEVKPEEKVRPEIEQEAKDEELAKKKEEIEALSKELEEYYNLINKINDGIKELKERKAKLKNRLKSIENRVIFYPTQKSDKKRIENEIKKIDDDYGILLYAKEKTLTYIREREQKIRELKEEIEKLENST